jgi:hypothetical protein
MDIQVSGGAPQPKPEFVKTPVDPSMLDSTFEVDAEVWEVLDTFGLAHVKTSSGDLYGLTRNTPGIIFSDLHEGQKVRCTVNHKFHRVLSAVLLESRVCQNSRIS